MGAAIRWRRTTARTFSGNGSPASLRRRCSFAANSRATSGLRASTGSIGFPARAVADTVDCYIYVGSLVLVDRNTASVPAGGFAALGFEGVAVVGSGGAPVWAQCRSSASGGPTDPGPWTSARLGAVRVPAIVNVP